MKSDDAERFCDLTSGVRLCYRVHGAAEHPALLLIAGLGIDMTAWPPAMVDSLSDRGLFVIRFDNRDAGRSTKMATPTPSVARLLTGRALDGGYHLSDMAEDAIGLLDHLGVVRAHVVGMSMGGMIGQTLAARHPQRIATLTSIFSTTGARTVGQPAWSTRLRMAAPAARDRDHAAARHLAMMRHIGGTSMAVDEPATALYAANAWDRIGRHNNEAGINRQINAIFAAGDRTPDLRRITTPTLVIHGDTDRMVHPSGGTATAAAIAGARLVTIRGMGHDLAPAAIEPIVELIADHISPGRRASAIADAPPVLPPGPRWPSLVAAAAFSVWRPRAIEHVTQHYGSEASIRLPLYGPTAVVSDPALIKQVFQAPDTELQVIEPDLSVMFGSGSTFGLRGTAHRRRRKLLVPPFHGKRMRAYEDLVEQETLREIDTWGDNVDFPAMPSTMRITLNIILRAVFGADGAELDELRELMPRWIDFGSKLFVVPVLHRDLGPHSPWGRHLAMRRQFDRIIDTLIGKALADPNFDERADVLSLLLRARYDDETALSERDIADELVTLLAAGHETTATTLAWALERLRRHPAALAGLVADVDAGGSTMLQATVFETQRTRPVIDGVTRRVVAPSYRIGRWVLPHGHHVSISATAVHNDPAIYANPGVFDPERFLGASPDNSAWVPFGGGTRRCIGAAFANMEMIVVLRTILRHHRLLPTTDVGEKQRFRGVAYAPARGGVINVRRRPATATTNSTSTASSATHIKSLPAVEPSAAD